MVDLARLADMSQVRHSLGRTGREEPVLARIFHQDADSGSFWASQVGLDRRSR
jgi:hypothetical protein